LLYYIYLYLECNQTVVNTANQNTVMLILDEPKTLNTSLMLC